MSIISNSVWVLMMFLLLAVTFTSVSAAKRPLHDPTTTGVLAGQSEDLQRCRR